MNRGARRRRLVEQLAQTTCRRDRVPALWRPEWPHLFADLRCHPGTGPGAAASHLPALVLAEGHDPEQPLTPTDWLVRRGWTYLEPPVLCAPLFDVLPDPLVPGGSPAQPMLLSPCEWDDATTPLTRPVDGEPEWWRRSIDLGRRCAVIVVQDVDLYAPDVTAELDAAATGGRAVWTFARMGPVPSESKWHFASAPGS